MTLSVYARTVWSQNVSVKKQCALVVDMCADQMESLNISVSRKVG